MQLKPMQTASITLNNWHAGQIFFSVLDWKIAHTLTEYQLMGAVFDTYVKNLL